MRGTDFAPYSVEGEMSRNECSQNIPVRILKSAPDCAIIRKKKGVEI